MKREYWDGLIKDKNEDKTRVDGERGVEEKIVLSARRIISESYDFVRKKLEKSKQILKIPHKEMRKIDTYQRGHYPLRENDKSNYTRQIDHIVRMGIEEFFRSMPRKITFPNAEFDSETLTEWIDRSGDMTYSLEQVKKDFYHLQDRAFRDAKTLANFDFEVRKNPESYLSLVFVYQKQKKKKSTKEKETANA